MGKLRGVSGQRAMSFQVISVINRDVVVIIIITESVEQRSYIFMTFEIIYVYISWNLKVWLPQPRVLIMNITQSIYIHALNMNNWIIGITLELLRVTQWQKRSVFENNANDLKTGYYFHVTESDVLQKLDHWQKRFCWKCLVDFNVQYIIPV